MAPTLLGSSSAGGQQVSSISVTYPTSSEGDFLLMGVLNNRADNENSFSATTPTDWNLLDTSGISGSNVTEDVYSRLSVYWRFRGNETSVSVAAGGTTNWYTLGTILAYAASSVDLTGPLGTLVFTTENANSTTCTNPSATTDKGDAAIALFTGVVHIGSTSSVDLTWTTATEQVEVGRADINSTDAYYDLGAATSMQPSVGSTGTYDCTVSNACRPRIRATVPIYPAPLLRRANLATQAIWRPALY